MLHNLVSLVKWQPCTATFDFIFVGDFILQCVFSETMTHLRRFRNWFLHHMKRNRFWT